MTETYPQEFPTPDVTAYNGAITYGLGRTTVPTALANQRKYFNAPRLELSLTFSMTNDEYLTWFDWMRENGLKWFRMPIVSPRMPVDITSTHRIRVMSDYQLEKQGDNWLSVTVGVEAVPGDSEDPFAPVIEPDWVIAGGPSNPSADVIIGGTPASPSTDWYRGEIYYY